MSSSKVTYVDEKTRHVETAERPLAGVVNELKDEAKGFLQTRIAMLQSEMRDKISAWKAAAPMIVIGAVLLITAWLMLSAALVAIIEVAFAGMAIGPFLALIIVGVPYLVLGAMLVLFALRNIRRKGMMPKRTIRVLRDDKIWLENEARTQL